MQEQRGHSRSTLFSFIQMQGDVRWGGRLIRPDYIMNSPVVFSTSHTTVNSLLAPIR